MDMNFKLFICHVADESQIFTPVRVESPERSVRVESPERREERENKSL